MVNELPSLHQHLGLISTQGKLLQECGDYNLAVSRMALLLMGELMLVVKCYPV